MQCRMFVDDGVRKDLFNRACKRTGIPSDGFTTTSESQHRRRDVDEVVCTTGLPQQGRDRIVVLSSCSKKRVIATGYRRIVYGDHGPYVDFDSNQFAFENFPFTKQKTNKVFYDERYTANRRVNVYEQRKSVRGAQPPLVRYSVRNNRPEGYADHQPNMYYIFVFLPEMEGDQGYGHRRRRS